MTATGFFTDATVCIGCKACEVACKEWNDVPDDGFSWSGFSYDNTVELGHSTWRHVKFVEGEPEPGPGGAAPEAATWQFLSDVCKHCEVAGCLEACPTGAIVRTEFEGVYIQPDICNGCGYCVVTCPFGVVDRRPDDGRAFKCTFCYDRQKEGLTPACAKACPTESIAFGPLEQMQAKAEERLLALRNQGVVDAEIYDAKGTSVGETHAIFLMRGSARDFNLPANPVAPTQFLAKGWGAAAVAAGLIVGSIAVAFRD
ncbi:MAG: 4Fe-4S dicluster domain-containing protein [Acidobacteria bacterium]|nr:4Fe-4S dicluster domain-containing protein [Acidobacteriota bacterium]